MPQSKPISAPSTACKAGAQDRLPFRQRFALTAQDYGTL